MPMKEKRGPSLIKISDDMIVWSGLLAAEVLAWPGVTAKPMFGMTALYRGREIFAALPKTRGMGSANAVAFKVVDAPAKVMTQMKRDTRISETVMAAAKWFVFEVESEADLRGALEWLGIAYEGADVSGRKH
jgi:hypothetical protein